MFIKTRKTKWIVFSVLVIFIFVFGVISLLKSGNTNININRTEYVYTKLNEENKSPVVFMQFYDWFLENSWIEDEFVDKIDWESIGVTDNNRTSEDFYYKMFSYIKSLGVDAISWEYHPRTGVEPLYPSENAINALRRSGLKIACFYDYEVAVKVYYNEEDIIATLSDRGSISPSDDVINIMLKDLKEFYDRVPEELLAYDKDGKQVVYVYGYDFDDSLENIDKWQMFGEELTSGVKALNGNKEPRFYWTSKNSPFAEHLFTHLSDSFVPFQFVLDTPQSQFSSSSVTWNLGYDNLGVQKRDNLQRVIRLDERYVKEMGWLSGATDCDAVFIYSWNEPFEGAMAIPTEQWGDTKARLVKEYIEKIKSGGQETLKKTLLIIDDFNYFYRNEKDDWHYQVEREMLLYAMRRYLPQADVVINENVTAELLDEYEAIVDISTKKDLHVCNLLANSIEDKQILVFDAKSGFEENSLSNLFSYSRTYESLDKDIAYKTLYGNRSKTFVRDDFIKGTLQDEVRPLISFSGGKYGALVKDNDIFVGTYNNDDSFLKEIFSEFYGVDMNISILYGEAYSSQRLEINAERTEITKNTCERYSVNEYWDIPESINWRVMPYEIDEKYYDFIFGLE